MTITLTLQCPAAEGDRRLSQDGDGDDVGNAILLKGSRSLESALSANNLLRYISSTFLPLAGPKMYETLNYGWGNTLLGFLALAFVPGPILFYKYGERLRTRARAPAPV